MKASKFLASLLVSAAVVAGAGIAYAQVSSEPSSSAVNQSSPAAGDTKMNSGSTPADTSGTSSMNSTGSGAASDTEQQARADRN